MSNSPISSFPTNRAYYFITKMLKYLIINIPKQANHCMTAGGHSSTWLIGTPNIFLCYSYFFFLYFLHLIKIKIVCLLHQMYGNYSRYATVLFLYVHYYSTIEKLVI